MLLEHTDCLIPDDLEFTANSSGDVQQACKTFNQALPFQNLCFFQGKFGSCVMPHLVLQPLSNMYSKLKLLLTRHFLHLISEFDSSRLQITYGLRSVHANQDELGPVTQEGRCSNIARCPSENQVRVIDHVLTRTFTYYRGRSLVYPPELLCCSYSRKLRQPLASQIRSLCLGDIS